MKITQDEMTSWVDGTLSAERRAAVDAHLQSNAEDAQLLADMRDALAALHEWNAAEPVAVSENFWPALREKLPEHAGNRALSGGFSRFANWIWPQRSAWQLRAGAVAGAAFVVLGVLFLAPKNATHSVQAAPKLSLAEQQFIRQSLVQHRTYAAVQPLAIKPNISADGHNQDGDGEDTDNESYAPQ